MTAGPLMLDLDGTELTPEERELLSHPMVGGVIFFARNFESREQITALCHAIRQLRPALLLAVDQEGGRVQRFVEGYTRLPAMAKLAAADTGPGSRGQGLVHDTGWLMAAEVLASGVDFSFAPVLDVDRDQCAVIADRAFSDDPRRVAELAGRFIDGMHEAGMAATGKHFPGHGSVTADSHLEIPVDPRELPAIRARDLVPFAELADQLDAVMPAHIRFPAVDEHCVGFSRLWLQQLLRTDLGYDGVIFSDDLSMKGADVPGGYPQKAALALAAGCDMILVCNNRSGALEVIDYLERSAPQPSHRLSRMKARRQWSWQELEAHPRRQQIVHTLYQLK